MILFIIPDIIIIANLFIMVLPAVGAAENMSGLLSFLMIGVCVPPVFASIASILYYREARETGDANVGTLFLNFLLQLGFAVGMVFLLHWFIANNSIIQMREGPVDPSDFFNDVFSGGLALVALAGVWGMDLGSIGFFITAKSGKHSMYAYTILGSVISLADMGLTYLLLNS